MWCFQAVSIKKRVHIKNLIQTWQNLVYPTYPLIFQYFVVVITLINRMVLAFGFVCSYPHCSRLSAHLQSGSIRGREDLRWWPWCWWWGRWWWWWWLWWEWGERALFNNDIQAGTLCPGFGHRSYFSQPLQSAVVVYQIAVFFTTSLRVYPKFRVYPKCQVTRWFSKQNWVGYQK